MPQQRLRLHDSNLDHINYLQLRKYPEEFTVSGSRLKKFMDYDKDIITQMMKNYTPNKN